MASKNCQNEEILLYIAKEVGRKVYLMGLDIDFNRQWYSSVERDAFMVGWLEAAEDTSHYGIAATIDSSGKCFIVN
jgi:hypothetical protein